MLATCPSQLIASVLSSSLSALIASSTSVMSELLHVTECLCTAPLLSLLPPISCELHCATEQLAIAKLLGGFAVLPGLVSLQLSLTSGTRATALVVSAEKAVLLMESVDLLVCCSCCCCCCCDCCCCFCCCCLCCWARRDAKAVHIGCCNPLPSGGPEAASEAATEAGTQTEFAAVTDMFCTQCNPAHTRGVCHVKCAVPLAKSRHDSGSVACYMLHI